MKAERKRNFKSWKMRRFFLHAHLLQSVSKLLQHILILGAAEEE